MANGTVLEENILSSIKKLLGLNDGVTVFDTDIVIHINTVFANLTQMGVGPQDDEGKNIGFKISTGNEVWGDFTANDILIENVKTYVYRNIDRQYFIEKSLKATYVSKWYKHNIKGIKNNYTIG